MHFYYIAKEALYFYSRKGILQFNFYSPANFANLTSTGSFIVQAKFARVIL